MVMQHRPTTIAFRRVSALLLMCCGRADAQGGAVRHGIWVNLAAGDGWAHMSSDGQPKGATRNGSLFSFDLGWTFGSRVRAGVGASQWARELGGGNEDWITSYGVSAFVYPVAHRSVFLEAGAGGSYYARVHVPPDGERADTTYLSGTGWGATVAAGWDARIGDVFTLRPRLAYAYGAPRTVRYADRTLLATHWKQRMVSVDVGIVLHPPDSW